MITPAPSLSPRTAALVTVAMLAFAGNSLLCRLALGHMAIDATSFTSIRLLSGAVVLWLLARRRTSSGASAGGGSWGSAVALFGYAFAFSLAYTQLSAATGALVLFGTVQMTMIGVGLWRGERLHPLQVAGLAVSLAGLVALLLPGLTAPPLASALLMAGAGVAWGIYSLRGRGVADPLAATAGNFMRAVPMAALSSLVAIAWLAPDSPPDSAGMLYAVASGALASGIGYAVWYAVLPQLSAVRASAVQLSVPVIAAVGGVLLLHETMSLRLALCSLAVLGGVALVILARDVRQR